MTLSVGLFPTPSGAVKALAYQSGCIKTGEYFSLYFCSQKRLHLLYRLCNCICSMYYVSGITIGSGDIAVKKADKNPCSHGTYSVTMTNLITSMIWRGSHRAILVLHPADTYMQVQKFLHPTNKVWVMLKTKFLSGQAERWLTYTKYGQNSPAEHMCWSKKIKNNQMPHLFLTATWRMWFCHYTTWFQDEDLSWNALVPCSSFLEELLTLFETNFSI